MCVPHCCVLELLVLEFWEAPLWLWALGPLANPAQSESHHG